MYTYIYIILKPKFACRYKSSSSVARLLVQVLAELPIASKRKFISFCTGCPRLPVGGLSFSLFQSYTHNIRTHTQHTHTHTHLSHLSHLRLSISRIAVADVHTHKCMCACVCVCVCAWARAGLLAQDSQL